MTKNINQLILEFSAKVDELRRICKLENNGIKLENFEKLQQELTESLKQISAEMHKLS